MEAYKTNVLIWRMFMSLSMKAANHRVPNYLTIVEIYKNTNFEKIESLFDITQKMAMEHSEEILNVRWLESSSPSEISIISWSSDQMGKGKNMCLCIFRSMSATDEWQQWSDSKMWRSKWKVSRCVDGEANEVEWKICTGFSSLAIHQEIQNLARKDIKPEELKDRIIFMTMFNDIDWSNRKNDENCISNAQRVKDYAMTFLQGHWTFPCRGSEERWYGKSCYALKGEWDSTANKMVQRFKETSHTVFNRISALSRGILKKKKGRDTIHFTGDSTNTELFFQTIHSENQLSIYGAVANWWQQFGLAEKENVPNKLFVDKNDEKCTFWRSTTFGISSAKGIWKQCA